MPYMDPMGYISYISICQLTTSVISTQKSDPCPTNHVAEARLCGFASSNGRSYEPTASADQGGKSVCNMPCNIYIYIIWYIPKTPKNQFKMDGNGETTMLVMYKDSRSSNWNNHLQMDSHQLPGMYTCETCSSPIALGVKHHPPKQGSFLIKNTHKLRVSRYIDNLGGNFMFFYFHLENWGWFPFWRIVFRWVGSTTN